MKAGLRLRRFRSEINFHDEQSGRNGATGITVSLQPRSAEEADASDLLSGEPLSHTVSQPSLFTSKPKRPTGTENYKIITLLSKKLFPLLCMAGSPHAMIFLNFFFSDLKGLASPRPDTYIGVEGKVLQAQGLHVAHFAQLYCRVKLQSAVSPEKQTRLSSNSAAGKTVQSFLLPSRIIFFSAICSCLK